MHLPFDIFGFPQHLSNYYSGIGRIDEESLVDLLRSKETVHRLPHFHVYLEEFHLSSIIRGLVLPAALWVLNIMVLLVDI